MARVKARKDAVSGESRTGVETSLRELERCTVYQGHARFESAREVSVGDGATHAPSGSSSTSAAAPACRRCPESTTVPYLTNSSMMDVDFLPGISSSSAAATSASSSRRCSGGSAARSRSSRWAPRLDPARRRGRVGGDPGDPRARGHRRAPERGVHRRRADSGDDDRGARQLRRRARRRSRARTCCSRSAAVRTPTTSASTRPASLSTSAATSRSTTSCGPTCPGIWAIGDCNGKRRVHAHRLQRLRDRRGEPARRRPRRVSDRITAYALYIDPPLGRAGMTEAEVAEGGRPRAGRHAADDRRQPRGRERRDPGLHEDRRGCRDARKFSARRSSGPAATRSIHCDPRHDVREGALHRPAARDAHPSDSVGAGSDDARGAASARVFRAGIQRPVGVAVD